METSITANNSGPIERLIVALVTAAFVVYPIPGFAQQSGAESNPSETSEESNQQTAQQGDSDEETTDDGPTPDVYLLPTKGVRDQLSSIVPERIGEMLRERLGSTDRINLLPTFRSMTKTPGDSKEAVSAAIEEAQTQYTSGIGLLESGDHEKAAEYFAQSVETLRENIGDLDNFDIYTDALSNLARSHWETGHDYDARKSIKEFAHLRPGAELDPEKYPDELRKLFEKEVSKVEKAGSGTLVVEANVEGADVFVDGEKKGTTPATIEDTKFGYHYLVVRNEGSATWSKQIRVRGRGKTQNFEVELESTDKSEQQASSSDEEMPAFYTELQASIKSGNFGTDLKPYLEELAKQTDASFIAWVAMVKNDNEYVATPFVYSVSDGVFVQADDVAFDFELANLMVGVRDLSGRLVDAALEMPDDKMVTSVSLVEEEQKNDAVAAAGSDAKTDEDEKMGATPPEKGAIDAPPEPKPSNQGGSTWTYVGIGTAVVAVGALAAGGAILFSDAGEGSSAAGFTANVEW